MDSRQPVILIRDMTKVYRMGEYEVRALNGVSIAIAVGEFVAIMGPSGSGKSTMMNMLGALDKPSGGQYLLDGTDISALNDDDLADIRNRKIGFVFQSFNLLPRVPAIQQVELPLIYAAKGQRAERARRALEMVGLGDRTHHRPSELSGGQQQRVALARALVNRPQVLLLDEPLGALDLKLRKAMQSELKQIQTEVGITFIYVTHDQEEAMAMSDRIGIMHEGLLQQVGSPHEVYEKPVNRFVADFIGETNFLPATVSRLETEEEHPMVMLQGNVPVLAADEGHELRLGQSVTLTLRPERINLYPQGKVDVLKAESGLEAEELERILGAKMPGPVDMKEFLLAEPENVVIDGVLEEAFYIGTDTRFRVTLQGGASLVVRQQNYGSRYDLPYDVGSRVYVQWAAENAQILID